MYYLVIMQNTGTENPTCAVYSYSDRDAAFAAYHSELAYRSESRINTVCLMLNENGYPICRESYGLNEG